MSLGFLLLFGLGSVAAPEASQRVVVFPLDPLDVPVSVLEDVNRALVAQIQRADGWKVIEPATAAQSRGVNLAERAYACQYDVLCLTEVAEVLRADRLVIGHLKRREPGQHILELKIAVLDGHRASLSDVILWQVDLTRPSEPVDAVQAAARRLFQAPDAQVTFHLAPETAKVRIYGKRVPLEGSNVPFRYWGGRYRLQAEAPGFQTLNMTVTIPSGATNFVIPLELAIDPLSSDQAKVEEPQAFDQSSRRRGSGVLAYSVSTEPEEQAKVVPRSSESGFSKPLPWIVFGVGAGLAAGGGFLLVDGQNSYNEVAAETRFSRDVTSPSAVASAARDDAQGTAQAGSVMLISGIVVAVGSVVWMVVDEVLSSNPERELNAEMAE
jgi:hypothetical protein